MNLTRHEIAVDGVRRSYLVAEPAGPASAVVLSLHGSRSSASEQARLSRLAALAETSAAAVVFPEAIVPAGRGSHWDLAADLGYLAELVDELRTRYPTPRGRVCMTGMSGGARMACRFAWTHAEAVSMVGAVAGLRGWLRPSPPRAVPIVAFHGTSDRTNPYAGGATARWEESVPEAARRWAVANGAPSEPEEVVVSANLTRTTYGTRGAPGEVTLWTARGAGHTWPGSHMGILLRLFLGRTSMDVSATDEIWAFARRHAGDP